MTLTSLTNHISHCTCMCLLAIATSGWSADLIDITFQLSPNCDLYGGMGKTAENGTATARLVAPSNAYIKNPEARPFGDPKALVTRKSPLPPVCNGFYQTEQYEVRTPVTDTVMHILFLGKLTGCRGGGTGQEPEFKSTVVHLDVDVDSDNDNRNSAGQREPNRGITEDKLEEDGMGLLLAVNRGQHETLGNMSQLQPKDDDETDGIKASDPDLAVMVVEVRGRDGTLTIIPSGAGKVNVFRADDLNTPVSTCRVSRTPTNAGERFYLEGIKPGQVDLEFRFVPDGGQQYSLDKIRTTVIDCEISDVVPSYFANSKSWVPIKFTFTGAPSSVRVIDQPITRFYALGTVEAFAMPLGTGSPLKTKPENGTVTEYLGIQDEAHFNEKALTAGVLTDTARFTLRNVMATIAGREVRFSSSKRSTAIKYGDKAINVIEIDPGNTNSFRLSDAATG